ncbi:NADH dehydrogenase [Amycolatopsis marina]|uniref:NADH dehydrogenase n=2 Tax=Amycolatopsis marina TaxID=490629 RepID=A0A1I0WQW9_9PSEU|nr:NAD(P)/FAD-dependent oxidoreductase [Amycolatopsis marina]SFA91155.1 NADH dehydrogenase [Amycolatopsis marina]
MTSSQAQATNAPNTAEPTRIVVIGGGYVGMTAARRLRAALSPDEAKLIVIDPRSYMTYQPFLAEAAAGSVEPRHVVVPLREVLNGCQVMSGEVTGVESARRAVTLRVADGHIEQLSYDILVVAPGSVSKTLPIPGLTEHAVGFKTLEEAIYLRNHVLSRLDAAASTLDPDLRRTLLTFVFVGGGYAGVEAMAELEDLARQAARNYVGVSPDDMRWVLVEAADRIMPEVSLPLAHYTLDRLAERGFENYLGTTLKSCEDSHVVLGNGVEFDAGTIVWTAGVKPNPMLADTDLPLDERGRVRCTAALRVEGVPGVFAAGDCAAVPDLTSESPDAVCAPSAQHATRQAKQLVKNILAELRGGDQGNYRHSYAGSVASLGLYRGVAEIYGVKLRGAPAWALHRLYHLATMPTAHRKARIAADWLLSLPFGRQIVATGELHEPHKQFARAGKRR